jgi:putative membrane protein
MSRTLLTSALTAAALMLAMNPTQAQQSQQPSGQTQPAPPQQPPRQAPPEPSSQPPRTTPSSPTSQPQGAAAHKGMPSDAAAFVNQMTIANLAEVQLGKLASERASNADVKSYGQMMVKDHSEANQDLAQVAAQLKVKPTTELDQKHKDLAAKLSKLQGAEFDREYISAMVQGHQEVAGQLEARSGSNASSSAPGEGRSTTSESTPRTPTQSGGQIQGSNRTDGDQHALTEWAKRTLPTVQKHLARARELQSQVSK